MTVGARMHYAEILRHTREQLILSLAATNAVVARQRRARAPMSGVRAQCLDIAARLAEAESETLADVSSALCVLRETPERFGVCDECGEAIPRARLNAEPWATRCDAHADAELIVQ